MRYPLYKVLTSVAPGQSLMSKVAHLQVVVVVKAVWDIFDNTNGSMNIDALDRSTILGALFYTCCLQVTEL